MTAEGITGAAVLALMRDAWQGRVKRGAPFPTTSACEGIARRLRVVHLKRHPPPAGPARCGAPPDDGLLLDALKVARDFALGAPKIAANIDRQIGLISWHEDTGAGLTRQTLPELEAELAALDAEAAALEAAQVAIDQMLHLRAARAGDGAAARAAALAIPHVAEATVAAWRCALPHVEKLPISLSGASPFCKFVAAALQLADIPGCSPESVRKTLERAAFVW